MMRALIGVVFIAATLPSWIFLGRLGLDVSSASQWYNLIWNIATDPLYYPGILLAAVGWSVAAPVVGILLLVSSLFAKRSNIQSLDMKSSRSRAPLNLAPVAAGPTNATHQSQPSASAKETASAQSAEPQEEEIPSPPRAGLFAGLLGRLFARRNAAEEGPSDPELEEQPDEQPVAVKGPGLAAKLRSAIAGIVPARRAASRPALEMEVEPKEPEMRREDELGVPERLIEWYGAWGNVGRQQRPPRLVEQAIRLHAEINKEQRNAIIARFGMRGLSAMKAVEAAAEHLGDAGDKASTMPRPAVEELLEKAEAAMPAPPGSDEASLAGQYDTDIGDDSDQSAEPAAAGGVGQDINPFDLLDKEGSSGSGSSIFGDDLMAGAGEKTVGTGGASSSDLSAEYGEYAGNILEIEDDTNNPDQGDDTGSHAEPRSYDAAGEDMPGAANPERDHDAGSVFDPFSLLADAVSETTRDADEVPDHDQETADVSGPEDEEDEGARAVVEDVGARMILESVFKQDLRGSDGAEPEGDDERSSTTMSNERMEEELEQKLTPDKLRIILGEREDGDRALARKMDEIGLGKLTDRNPFIPTLWAQIEKAVDYQTRAFAWEHFGDQPPGMLATPDQREAFLIKVATSIITLREQISPETLDQILDIKKDTEQASWLSRRADLILQGLTSERNKSRIKALISADQPRAQAEQPISRAQTLVTGQQAEPRPLDQAEENVLETLLSRKGQVGQETARKELAFVETPYEDNWKHIAPVLDAYKDVTGAKGIEVYRALQVVWRPTDPEQEPHFGIVDALIGDLRVRTREKIEPMIAGVVAVMFVVVPAGQWRLDHTGAQDELRKDRVVLIGEGATEGQAVRVRDRNLEICRRWLEAKGLRCHGIVHFILGEGATLTGADSTPVPYEMRTSSWSAQEWDEVSREHVLPKR